MRTDGTTILFGWPGVRGERVARVADGDRVVPVVTDDPAAAGCPECGVFATAVRPWRVTRPRDIPYGAQPLAVRGRKRQ